MAKAYLKNKDSIKIVRRANWKRITITGVFLFLIEHAYLIYHFGI